MAWAFRSASGGFSWTPRWLPLVLFMFHMFSIHFSCNFNDFHVISLFLIESFDASMRTNGNQWKWPKIMKNRYFSLRGAPKAHRGLGLYYKKMRIFNNTTPNWELHAIKHIKKGNGAIFFLSRASRGSSQESKFDLKIWLSQEIIWINWWFCTELLETLCTFILDPFRPHI